MALRACVWFDRQRAANYGLERNLAGDDLSPALKSGRAQFCFGARGRTQLTSHFSPADYARLHDRAGF